MIHFTRELIENSFKRDLNYCFRRTDAKGTQAVSRAERIYDNNIYLIKAFPESKVNSIPEIWNLKGEPNNTYQAYLHSLQFVSYLCNGFEHTKDVKFMEKAEQIIKSWLEVSYQISEGIIWYDFTVANRTIVITHFINLCIKENYTLKKELKISLLRSLINHGQYLYDNKNYVDNNHGIMMDRALLQLATILYNYEYAETWAKKALSRLEKQLKDSFTVDYINVENSPAYHDHTYRLFCEVKDFIDFNNILFENIQIKNLLEMIYQRHLEMLKPDHSYPLIGDTEKIYFLDDKPQYSTVVYPETGLAILKDKNCYITLKSGYVNLSHKHLDDLSFTIYYKGYDLFTDGGKYNYNNKDPYRKYIVSPFSHNTIIVDNKEYPLDLKSSKKLGIVNYALEDEFECIELINDLYEGVKIKRFFFLLKPNLVIILDRIQSDSAHEYVQNFILHQDILFSKISKEKASAQSLDGNIKMTMTQHKDIDDMEYSFGDKINTLGFTSEKFGEIVAAPNLSYQVHKEQGHDFLTSILFEESTSAPCEVKEYTILQDIQERLIVSLKNKEGYQSLFSFQIEEGLSGYDSLQLKDTQYTLIDENKVQITINAIGKHIEYACYVLIDDKIIHKFPYQKSNVFEFETNQTGEFKVWTFVRLIHNPTLKLVQKNNSKIII
ncbi:heparinase II/III domain-containing protein [Bacillus cereus group sp. MYBK104-1]|uniref:heparinase II/III domain-containing protein n=1 Tax=unclassified Bacillus cereus group TaxID=2750818 RepID=UPI003F7A18E4|nr:heparinase II/III family protein [Bacillus cereus]MDA2671716.1 heparinase II/III family protein [Bacillus cereus]